MTESLIPIAPALDEPLEILSACHGRVRANLQTLDRLVRWLPDHGADEDAQQAAVAVMRYFDLGAMNHHKDEEEDLFPLLLERCTSNVRMRIRRLVSWIQDDHRELEGLWRRLREQLAAIAAGDCGDLEADLVADFSAQYLNHIDREDNELFPLAANFLTEDDIRHLSEQMRLRRTSAHH